DRKMDHSKSSGNRLPKLTLPRSRLSQCTSRLPLEARAAAFPLWKRCRKGLSGNIRSNLEKSAVEQAVNSRNFFAELKRRNVYKVAVAYAVVGWLLIQIATQVFPFFEIPNWGVRLVVLIVAAGFPIALILAWAFELTPEGLKRTEFADELPTKAPRNRAWIYVVTIGAAISIGLFFLGRYTATSKQSGSIEVPAKSIAVLPLVNTSGDAANDYFS